MDPGWQFIRQDVSGADATAFDDSTWSPVSTPHTYNDTDSFRVLTNHSTGDTGVYQGPAWYRKHFRIPAAYSGNKAIIEFERIKQGATFYMNGTQVGVHDDGITACGIDVTEKVNFGDAENVLAVRVDNSSTYVESTTATSFQWNNRATNPSYGGLIGHVWLHLPGKIYQTYPLYNNLQTSGIYIYGADYANINAEGNKGDLTLNVEAEVSNESGSAQSASLDVKVLDPATGTVIGTFQGTDTSLPTTGTTVLNVSGALIGANLWSDISPSLYNVITTLNVGGKDVNRRNTITGFRKTEFKGGAGTGGVYVNGRFVYLLGFAQNSTNEWAGLGEAVPDWMHDYHANMIRGANSNYIRWMHITPQRIDVASGDKYGVVSIAPAGDKESDPAGVQWTQRLNVMRASMVYLRNNPSVFFWEVGNCGVAAAQMKDMADVQALWDPREKGGRGLGDLDMADDGGAPYAQWFGTMMAYYTGGAIVEGGNYFRGYSPAYRDQGPILELEDFRDEAVRGIWDDYSPPSFGFKPGPTDTYQWNSESFIVGVDGQVSRLNGYLNLYTISNTDSSSGRYSAYASLHFSDSNADGRLQSSSVAESGGKVDAVRLPKQVYYSFRVAGNTQPDIHIIGHWSYPAGTTKTMYVLANHVSSVELFVNGVSQGKLSSVAATNHYAYRFPNIAWAAGSIKAVGYDASGAPARQHELTTAGPATAIRLTPTVGPGGLQADGADVVMYDVEVVDANGQLCPTDEDRVDFAMTGPGTWRGGYNTRVPGSTNNMYLLTEAGINRVFIRSTLTPGEITLTASRAGLTSGTATVSAKPVPITNGLL
jgi:beta-galactosidase